MRLESVRHDGVVASAAGTVRKLDGEVLLGKGLTSEVFSWGDDRVLKLGFGWRPASAVEREYAVTRALDAAGLPVPAAHELVEIEGRFGIVFERVRGASLLHHVQRQPWRLFAAARQLAELHAQVHSYVAPAELPSQREQIEGWISEAVDFSRAEKEIARRVVMEFPEGNAVCHGDFHPANILLTARGPVLIDWSRATRGQPLADVARTSVLFESASLPPETPVHIRALMKGARNLLHQTYLKRYLQLRPGTMAPIERWRVPQRAAVSAWRASQERRAALGVRDWTSAGGAGEPR